MLRCERTHPLLILPRARHVRTDAMSIQEKEEYSESETPDSKCSRTDQCENESASDAQESGSDLEPENELEPESSSVQTSSTTESSSRRGKRKQACKFNNDCLTRRGHWLNHHSNHPGQNPAVYTAFSTYTFACYS